MNTANVRDAVQIFKTVLANLKPCSVRAYTRIRNLLCQRIISVIVYVIARISLSF